MKLNMMTATTLKNLTTKSKTTSRTATTEEIDDASNSRTATAEQKPAATKQGRGDFTLTSI